MTITPDFSDDTFTGKYFSDYPITITAKANDEYTFKRRIKIKISNKKILHLFLHIFLTFIPYYPMTFYQNIGGYYGEHNRLKCNKEALCKEY